MDLDAVYRKLPAFIFHEAVFQIRYCLAQSRFGKHRNKPAIATELVWQLSDFAKCANILKFTIIFYSHWINLSESFFVCLFVCLFVFVALCVYLAVGCIVHIRSTKD